MRVAIVGTRDRSTDADKDAVYELIDKVASAHFDVLFICTNTWKKGVGSFVRDKCLEKVRGQFRFQVILVEMRSYSHDRSRTEMAEVYLARNAAIFELADMLYYFANPDRKGTLEDLVGRMTTAGRPVRVFLPGEEVRLYGA